MPRAEGPGEIFQKEEFRTGRASDESVEPGRRSAFSHCRGSCSNLERHQHYIRSGSFCSCGLICIKIKFQGTDKQWIAFIRVGVLTRDLIGLGYTSLLKSVQPVPGQGGQPEDPGSGGGLGVTSLNCNFSCSWQRSTWDYARKP